MGYSTGQHTIDGCSAHNSHYVNQDVTIRAISVAFDAL
jgi:hypothetical protein